MKPLAVPIRQLKRAGELTKNAVINRKYNRVKIYRGTFMASNPTFINENWRTYSAKNNSLIELIYDEYHQQSGNVKRSKLVKDKLDMILANLFYTVPLKAQLVYSRAKRTGNTECFIADFLIDNGYVTGVTGKQNQYEGNSSWLIVTSKLKLLFETMKVKVKLANNAAMIEVRGKKVDGIAGKPKSLISIRRRKLKQFKAMNEPVQQYNRLWLNHSATIKNFHLVPYSMRVFNESLDYGGRFYRANHLELRKEDRKLILIDNEETIEPDFKAMHYCMLYALAGELLNPFDNDPYMVEGYSRDTIKIVSLSLLNSENIKAFKANVTKSSTKELQATSAWYKRQWAAFEAGEIEKKPKKPKSLLGFIEGLPNGISGGELYEAICKKHSIIAHLFGTEKIGVKLQNTDSNIMAAVLSELAKQDIPALPVHDSIRVKKGDLLPAVTAMKEAYFNAVKQPCFIDF